jgi:hypothetical protein
MSEEPPIFAAWNELLKLIHAKGESNSDDDLDEWTGALVAFLHRPDFSQTTEDTREQIRSAKAIVWIKWIGTHADYDKIDVKTVAYDA